MRRVTISASIKFIKEIKTAISKMEKSGITAYFEIAPDKGKDETTDEFIKRLTIDHFGHIDRSEGIYVICPKGYIGINTSLEIGYALGKNKKIIFSEEPKDRGIKAFSDTIIPIKDIHELRNL